MINECITAGKIVPSHVTASLLQKAMDAEIDRRRSEGVEGETVFLIDGFPRDEGNVSAWNETLSDRTQLLFVLFFDCPLEVSKGS